MFKVTVLLLIFGKILYGQDELFINPQETHNSINRWLDPHLVINSPGAHNKILFLFLPGINHKTSDTKLILHLADSLGYHAIGLSYPNTWDINDLCGNSEDSTCHENTRFEITYGVDLNEQINVNWINSVEGRLVSLLEYLIKNFPGKGWEEFLTREGIPEWSKMIIAGHSQGGGNAALIAKFNEVSRLVLFSSPRDYSTYYSEPASWLSDPFVTPLSNIFTFAHRQDFISFYYMIWKEMDLYNFGPPVNADAVHSPFNNSHMLTTNVFPGPEEDYSGSVVLDRSTPKDNLGMPLFKEEWLYLCFNEYSTGIADAVEVISPSDLILFPNFPNPFNAATTIQFILPQNDFVSLEIYNSIGEKVVTLASAYFNSGTFKYSWNAGDQPSGIYFVRLNNSKTNLVQKILLLK